MYRLDGSNSGWMKCRKIMMTKNTENPVMAMEGKCRVEIPVESLLGLFDSRSFDIVNSFFCFNENMDSCFFQTNNDYLVLFYILWPAPDNGTTFSSLILLLSVRNILSDFPLIPNGAVS
jgi:hypothetical protein